MTCRSFFMGVCTGFVLLAASAQLQAQQRLKLLLENARDGKSVPGANIRIPSLHLYRLSDEHGRAVLLLPQKVKNPIEIFITCTGYHPDTLCLETLNRQLTLKLQPGSTLQTLVVSATRMPESLLQTGVTVERADHATLIWTPAASLYEALALRMNLQEVQSGLLFPSYSSRGFASTGNFGFNQVIDGMNLESPGLNLRLGDFMGIPELDLDYVELLNGASTVLYGAGGANGTLVFQSKSPFSHQGLDILLKQGLMHLKDPSGTSPSLYQTYGIRYAHSIGRRLAFKLNGELVRAQDWVASDTGNYSRQDMQPISGNRYSDPAYDGINVYGDEIQANLSSVAAAMVSQKQLPSADLAWVPDENVSRTGYPESLLVSSETNLAKLDGAVSYRLRPETTLMGSFSWASGSVPYTGADRYALKNLHIWQGKLELKGPGYLLRMYRNQENTDDTYDVGILGQGINVLGASNAQWYSRYLQRLIDSRKAGMTLQQANGLARASADSLMPVPGSAGFRKLEDVLKSTALPKGAAFVDRSYSMSYEGLYKLPLPHSWGSWLFGGNYRRVHLNSNGTIYDDQSRRLLVDSWGLFGEWSRQFLGRRLRINAAVRYDQLQYLDHHWTPRLSLVWKLKPKQYLRFNFQTAYQLPSNQQQYIDLNTGRAILVGDAPELISKYQLGHPPVFLTGNVAAYASQFQSAYQHNLQSGLSDTAARNQAYRSSEPLLQAYGIPKLKPEMVSSMELGYRAILLQELYLDVVLYGASYREFLGPVYFLQAPAGPVSISSSDPEHYYGPALLDAQKSRTFGMQVNSNGLVESLGASLSLRWLLPMGYQAAAEGSFNRLVRTATDVQVPFNTSEWQGSLGLSNSHVYRSWGLSVFYRFQSRMNYIGNFASGPLPGWGTWNLSVGYRFRRVPLLLQLQGQNLLNRYYRSAYGNPSIGGLYLLSLRWHGL